MSITELTPTTGVATESSWEGFRGALWQREINVRAFIQLNYTPYDGDASFLAPATARTQKIWGALTTLFVEERNAQIDADCGRLENVRRIVAEARRKGLLDDEEDDGED